MPQATKSNPNAVFDAYRKRIREGALTQEAAQKPVIEALDKLNMAMSQYRLQKKSSALGWLFARNKQTSPPPKGLYIWGKVGRGKTMLMDLFFEASAVQRKQRLHFHAFMQEIHKSLHIMRNLAKENEDPLDQVIDDVASQTSLLCFDEFVVTDIADAMIMARLFSGLFDRGVVVVATSNTHPEKLYQDGLQRIRFEPFIDRMMQELNVLCLDHTTDYRQQFESGGEYYFSPLTLASVEKIKQAWTALAAGAEAKPMDLSIQGRIWHLKQTHDDVVKLTYQDACKTARSANDYLALTEVFDVIILSGVPVFSPADRNEAKRFITFIDTIYDRGKKLIISADALPNQLYVKGDHAIEFERTGSRLIEMQSLDYFSGQRSS